MSKLRFAAFMACILAMSMLIPGCSQTPATADSPKIHTLESEKPQDYSALYADAINDYERIVEFRLSQNFEENYNNGRRPALTKEWPNYVLPCDGLATEESDARYRWNCMLIDMLDYINEPTKESFGYIFTDLSEDGIPELVWISIDYRIFCIFTIVDDQVRLVDSFWSRYACVIQETGELYILKNGGATNNVYAIARIRNDTGSVISQIEFGQEDGIYYKKGNNQYYVLTEQEYEELCNEYPFVISDIWKENTVHFFKGEDGSLS